MSTARKLGLVSADEYLAREQDSPIKHEYVDGIIYAMAGGRNAHNMIKVNTIGALLVRLRNGRCRPFDADTKIRIRRTGRLRFYYPDVSIVCRPNPQSDVFQDKPSVLFEVLSRRTRRIDEGEKKDAYLTIPSLNVYVLVEQDSPLVVAYRRTNGRFVREVYQGLDAVLPLPEIKIDLPLSEIYQDVDFIPERDKGEG